MLQLRHTADLNPVFALGVLALLASPPVVPPSEGAATAPPACVRFELAAKGGFSMPKRWKGVARLYDPETLEVVAEAAASNRTTVVCAAAGRSVEGAVEVAGFWIRREPVTLGAPGSLASLPLRAWPLGTITGSLAAAKDRPTAVEVTTLPARGARLGAEPPPGRMDCPVDANGRFSCDLPAALYDLQIAPRPFVPAYLSGVRVDPAARRELGAIPMRRGASIAGWVAVDGARFEPSRTRVRLRPGTVSGAPPDPHRTAQVEGATMEVPVRGDGFFQLVGVPPGVWELEAEQPPLAPARESGLRVEPETETVLREPLYLRPKEALALRIDPPLDWSGARWQVALRAWVAGTDRLEPKTVFEGNASEDGEVRLGSEPPGRFLLSVKDARGATFFSDFHFALAAGQEGRVEIRWVDVAGRLYLGKKPLAAKLWFGFGGRGVSGEPVESDADGAFALVLPFEGSWPVEIEATEGGVRAQLPALVEADRDRRARLDLRLPDTRLFGRVSLVGGRPAAGAKLFLGAEEGGAGVLIAAADSMGEFSLRGLPTGRVALAAEWRDGEGTWSAPAEIVSVADGGEAGPVDLVLRRKVRLSGRVVSPQGPVAGAVISAWPFGGAPGVLGRAGSERDGTFTFDAPAESGPLVLVPRAPGFALRAFVRPVGTEPLVLELSREAGTLEVVAPWLSDRKAMGLALAYFEDGIALPYGNLLARWAMAEGAGSAPPGDGAATIRIPALAPGRWEVCALPSYSLSFSFATGGDVPRQACAGGTLTNGATLRLEVPKPAALGH